MADIDIIKRWLQEVIIGHNLCPFAKEPWLNNSVRIVMFKEENFEEELLKRIGEEVSLLVRKPKEKIETSILVFSQLSLLLEDWNDINHAVMDMITANGQEGIIQSVMFHPEFRFMGSDPEDVTNAINRSPFPLIHLIREESITAIVDKGIDTKKIIARNISYLEEMGWTKWKKMMNDIMTKP